MSNTLRKKKPKMLGYNTAEQHALDRSVQYNKANDKIFTTAYNHLAYMGFLALDDRFGYGRKRLTRYWDATTAMLDKWLKGGTNIKQLKTFAEKSGFDVKAYVNGIPLRYKVFLAEMKNNRGGMKPDTRYVLDAPFTAFMLINIAVLKVEFKFSKNMLEKFGKEMIYYIESYVGGWTSDETVKEIMLNENKMDLERGIVG